MLVVAREEKFVFFCCPASIVRGLLVFRTQVSHLALLARFGKKRLRMVTDLHRRSRWNKLRNFRRPMSMLFVAKEFVAREEQFVFFRCPASIVRYIERTFFKGVCGWQCHCLRVILRIEQ